MRENTNTTLLRIVSITSEFQLHGAFRSDNLEKKLHRDSILIFFMVNSHDKGTTSEISLSKDLIDKKALNPFPPKSDTYRFYSV